MFLLRSGKDPGSYGNFFLVVVIPGQKSGGYLLDHWSSGLKFTCETDNLTISMRFKAFVPLQFLFFVPYMFAPLLMRSATLGCFQWLVEPYTL